MISKVNGIVSMTGEKLYEPQFIQAVHEAEKESKIKTKFFVGFADVEESLYHFYFEFADESVNQEQADAFAKVVDEHLQKINIEYEAKRSSFRLHEPKAHILQSNAYARFKTACLKDGFRDGQFKFNLLMQDEIRRRKFSFIEKLQDGTISQAIMEKANEWDERMKKNRAERAKRRGERHERREERREARQERREIRSKEREQRRSNRQIEDSSASGNNAGKE